MGAVIASEAKQSRLQCRLWICFVADAPRNDGLVIASEAKQIQATAPILDCFVASLLAMPGHKARQDGAASIRPC
jgi:hypothetical protein